MNTEHTKEPWRVCEDNPSIVIGSDNKKVFYPIIIRDDKVNDANAKRTVDCVNALAGLSNDALDDGWSFKDNAHYKRSLEKEIEQLKAINAELVEVLKKVDEAMSYMSVYDIPICLPDEVKAALAKASENIEQP